MRAIDISGQKFGLLTAVRYEESREQGGYMRTFWRFVCECGKERVAAKSDVTCGKIISCGCFRRQVNEERRQEAQRKKEQLLQSLPVGLTDDQRANRSVVPESLWALPSRLIAARHAAGKSVGTSRSPMAERSSLEW